MPRLPRPVAVLLVAEALAFGYVLVAFGADRLLGLGPDGALTRVLVLTFPLLAATSRSEAHRVGVTGLPRCARQELAKDSKEG